MLLNALMVKYTQNIYDKGPLVNVSKGRCPTEVDDYANFSVLYHNDNNVTERYEKTPFGYCRSYI